MVWGTAKRGIADIIEKLEANDAKNDSQIIMRMRTISADDAIKLAEVLKRNTTLKELYASGHKIDEKAAIAIAEALLVNRTLTKMCIGDSTFGDAGVMALANGLASNQGLLVLDLEYKSVGIGGAASLANMLRLPTHVLKELLLSRNELNDEAVVSLSDGVQHSGSLRLLDLSENAFGVKGAAALGDALATAGLKTLKVSKNLLTDAGGTSIVTAAAINTHLTELWLDECAIGDETLKSFSAALGAEGASTCALATLHLENSPEPLQKNQIGAEGATALAAALALGSKHCQLASINLRSNSVLNEGARAFAAAIKQSGDTESERMGAYDQRAAGSGQPQSTLRHLDLSGNSIGCAATAAALVATAVVGAGHAGSGLERLHLFNNDLGDEVCSAVAEVLSQAQAHAQEQQWCSLIQLDLGANKISSVGCKTLLGPLVHYTLPNPSLTVELGGNDMGPEGEDAAVALKAATNGHVDIARDKPNGGPSAEQEDLDAKEEQQQGLIGAAGTESGAGAEAKPVEHHAELCKRAGNSLYASKQYEEAAAKYGEAITLVNCPTPSESSGTASQGPAPEVHVLYSNRSMCYIGLRQYEKACEDAQLCINERVDFSKGYHRLVR
jgi:Ran GTPase-activating protein (RanGAP) involved in mRNA processing and transport